MTPLELFRLLIIEFADVVDSQVLLLISIAQGQMNLVYFGVNYDLASVWLAAHMLARSRALSSVSGPITSHGTGDLSESYGVSVDTSEYSETSYGRQFLRLRNMGGRGAELIS